MMQRLLWRGLLVFSFVGALACSGSDGPTTARSKLGNLVLEAVTNGSGKDVAYVAFVDDMPAQLLLSAGTDTAVNLSPSQHAIRIAGIAPNCTLSGGPTQTVTIAAHATLTDTLRFNCSAVTEKILYGSNVDGNNDLYVSSADGSDFTRLTSISASSGQWSPDGSHLIFTRPTSAFDQIFVADSVGAHETQLTTDGVNHDYPQWSPDGALIAFTAGPETWIMNADGSASHRISAIGVNQAVSWSPDGNGILLSDGISVIAMKMDGTGAAVVGNMAGGSPVWSPDGSKIAFLANGDSAAVDMFVMDAHGGHRKLLIPSVPGVFNDQIAWSPDGSRIAFRTNRDGGHAAIYVMNADGSSSVKLSNNIGDNSGPSWHP
jgi:Tol biopolymer transport system component